MAAVRGWGSWHLIEVVDVLEQHGEFPRLHESVAVTVHFRGLPVRPQQRRLVVAILEALGRRGGATPCMWSMVGRLLARLCLVMSYEIIRPMRRIQSYCMLRRFDLQYSGVLLLFYVYDMFCIHAAL